MKSRSGRRSGTATSACSAPANALSQVAYSVAPVVSAAISAAMIASGLSVVWLGLLFLGCLATTLLAVRLGRQLTRHQNRVEPAPEAVTA